MEKRNSAPDQAERDKILKLLDVNMVVEAAAGTGKTTSMVGRMVELLRHDRCKINTMAAVTFTRKAAAEMRGRFRIVLERAVAGAKGEERVLLTAALGSVEQAFIGTIHSFCGRMLRERPVEAGVDVSFREVDDEEDVGIRRQAWTELCSRLLVAGDQLAELNRLGLPLNSLEQGFVEYASYPDVDEWPVSKTTELVSPDKILKELKVYLNQMAELAPRFDLPVGTNDQLIPEYQSLPSIARLYSLSSENTHGLVRILLRMNRNRKIVQKDWPQGKEQAKGELARWNGFREQVVQPWLNVWYQVRYRAVMGLYQRAREVYDRLRQERGVLNYQDLLMKAAALVGNKPKLREYFRNRFSHLLVDEFQDTDPIQAQVMLYLTADDHVEADWRKCRPRPGSLFVVGDPKQSIYRFRRADIVTYGEVVKIIEAAGGQVVRLSANFRSRAKIIDWVNSAFRSRFPAAGSRQAPEYVPLLAGKKDGSAGEAMAVSVLETPGELRKSTDIIAREASIIARMIRRDIDEQVAVERREDELARGMAPVAMPGDFLIITRKKASLDSYALALEEYGIPSRVTGGTLMNDIHQLVLLRDCLAVLSRPDDKVALVALLRGELYGFSDVSLYAFSQANGKFDFMSKPTEEFADYGIVFERFRDYHAWTRKMPLVSAIESIADDLGLGALAAAGQKQDTVAGSFAKLIEVIRASRKDNRSLADIVAYLDKLVNDKQGESYDGIEALAPERQMVRIMNLHQVKGLEAPFVFLAAPTGKSNKGHRIGLHVDRAGKKIRGYLAIAEGDDTIARPPDWDQCEAAENLFKDAEETRLLYVAATRAGSSLTISQREKYQNENYWRPLEDDLGGVPRIDDNLKANRPAVRQGKALAKDEYAKASQGRQAALGRAIVENYWSGGAKLYALQATAPGDHISATDGEHGTEFGTAVHMLLEMIAENPDGDLTEAAKGIKEELGLDTIDPEEMVKLVRRVRKSALWARAVKSGRLMSEVPFQLLLKEQDKPVVVRGSVDLAFKEDKGWVLVDYKTDRLREDGVSKLADKYRPQLELYAKAWKKCTGEKVMEQGFYFTHVDKYEKL